MCGIFGIINHHKRQLDKRAFITLGCANDSRGGDACGVMIDRKVEKGTEKDDQYFQCWYPKSEVLKATEKCYVALGHCRKASVGGVAPEKAQPVTIHDKDGKLLFCLVHNGTIYNYKELANKYIPDVKIDGLTDSQVMAQIFFYKGYDVLAEYNGGGAFVIQDYRTNQTLMFRGESLGSLHSTAKVEAERPLYFVKTGKSVIFSSIYAVLQGLYWGFDAYDVPSNVLLECDGLTLYKVKEYDRSKCYGCKVYNTTVVNVKHTTSYNDDDDYGGFYGSFSGYSVSSKVDFDTATGLYINSKSGDLLHGIIYVSDYGYISSYSTGYNHPYYFWKGIMLSGENAYNAVRDLHASKATDKIIMNVAKRCSCNPVLVNKRFCTYDDCNKRTPFTEEYIFPLTDVAILCDEQGRLLVTYNEGVTTRFVPVSISKEHVNKIVDYVKNSIQ